jgi:hypothetical protein
LPYTIFDMNNEIIMRTIEDDLRIVKIILQYFLSLIKN